MRGYTKDVVGSAGTAGQGLIWVASATKVRHAGIEQVESERMYSYLGHATMKQAMPA